MPRDERTSVVVLTHNRAAELERCLQRLQALPERPPLVVVDNASSDDTALRVVRDFPQVELVSCSVNRGAAARNAGVERVRTSYVAFCDDDTWWAPGALARAADLLDAHPQVGAVAARVLVGVDEQTDPACERMARSPLDGAGHPGPALIAFMAGAVVMRRQAFREAGGYEPRFFLGAEERLLALDLASRGWQIVYAADVVTHHHPSAAMRDPRARRIAECRNRLWTAWLRLPFADAWEQSLLIAREAQAAGVVGPVLWRTLRGIGWALARRRVVPPRVRLMHRLVFGAAAGATPLPAPHRAAESIAGRR